MACKQSVIVSALSLALVSSLPLAGSLFAQQSKRPSGREAYESTRARDRNLQNRTIAMQHAGDGEKSGLSDAQLKTLVNRMKEDFRRLQIVNNDLMRSVAEREVLDYKNVAGATDEISKCARRLQALLSTPETENNKKDENKNPFDPKEMKSALFQLDDLIMSFVTSPLFKSLVDSENADKARRDLTGIINLSGVLKRNAEKLSKDVRNSDVLSQKPGKGN